MAASLYMRNFAYALDITKYVDANNILQDDIQWGPTNEGHSNGWVLWFWWDPTNHGGTAKPPNSVPPKDSSHA